MDRRAQAVADAVVRQKKRDDPTLHQDKDRLKKEQRRALLTARSRLNLTQPTITVSDRQWDAIQARAVSPSSLRSILKYVDDARIKELSMPRTNTVMTKAVSSRAKAMLAAGATNADIAAALGISASTLRAAIQRGDD